MRYPADKGNAASAILGSRMLPVVSLRTILVDQVHIAFKLVNELTFYNEIYSYALITCSYD